MAPIKMVPLVLLAFFSFPRFFGIIFTQFGANGCDEAPKGLFHSPTTLHF